MATTLELEALMSKPAPVVVFEQTGSCSGGAGSEGDLVTITIPGKIHGLFVFGQPIEVRLKISPSVAENLAQLLLGDPYFDWSRK